MIETISRLVRQTIARGLPVEIDGLGSFLPDGAGGIRYEPSAGKRVFLAYASEDRAQVLRLYDELKAAGMDPWMDCRRLMPGQNWPRAIEKAISVSDYFLPCLSAHSVKKRGRFQAEIRYALECATEVPLDRAFIVPVRLDECRVPERLAQQYQWVNLFPDWEAGVARLCRALGERESS